MAATFAAAHSVPSMCTPPVVAPPPRPRRDRGFPFFARGCGAEGASRLLGAPLETQEILCPRGKAMPVGTGHRHLRFARLLVFGSVCGHHPALGTPSAPISLADDDVHLLGRHLDLLAPRRRGQQQHTTARPHESFTANGGCVSKPSQQHQALGGFRQKGPGAGVCGHAHRSLWGHSRSTSPSDWRKLSEVPRHAKYSRFSNTRCS